MNIFNSYYGIRRMAAAFLAAAILTGCADKEEEPSDNAPLLIAANTTPTRTASPLEDKYSDFGVWAWKTNADDTQSLVLGRQSSAVAGSEYFTRIKDGDWTYEYSDASVTQYIRYWDRAAKNYFFSAYAPYKIDDTPLNSSHTITATADGVSISGVAGNTPLSSGIDWLEARWKRQIVPTIIDIDMISDQDTTANLTAIVPMAFHHILALTEFRIYSDMDTELKLTNITLTISEAIYTQADYSPDSWDYQSPHTGIFTSAGKVDLAGTTKADYRSLTTLLQIPQDVTGRTVQVNATLSDDSVRSGSFTLEGGWSREKKYIYYLCIKNNEIILMDFKAEPWTHGEDIEISEPVVNW